jgi:hypothetical protein
MEYSPRLRDLIARQKEFFASRRSGLLVRVLHPTHGRLMPLRQVVWNDPTTCRAYAESMLRFCRESWKARESLDDDYIPSLQNLAGVGAISGAYVKDPRIHQEEDTNYLETPITDWSSGLDRLGFDPDNLCFKAQMEMLKYYLEQWDGTFALSPYTHFDPLDLCNQLRGNDLFYDFYEHPDELRNLLEKTVTWILDLERYVREKVMAGYPMEGAVLAGTWVPGNYLSCDAGDLCSAEIFEEWGLPYTQNIVDAWGGAFLHHHELGIHQIKTWAKCRNLTVQFLNRDPNTRHLADIIDDGIIRESMRVPVSFIARYDEFMKRAAAWSRGRFVVLVQCDDLQQGREVVRLTRSLRS